MNTEELFAEWSRVCDKIKEYPTINASQMNAFFSRLVPQAMSDDFLMLTADNDFIKTWVERHYSDYIKSALHDLHGVEFTVAIEVDINQETQTVTEPAPKVEKTSIPNPEPTPAVMPEVETQANAPIQVSKAQKPSPIPAATAAQPARNYDPQSTNPTSTLTVENEA